MDQTTIDLLISNQDAIRADNREFQRKIDRNQEKLEEVQKDVGKIAGCIVGQEKCTEIMGKLTEQIQAVNKEVQGVKLVCQRNETGKDAIAEDHEKLVNRVDTIASDVQCLKDKEIIVDYKKGLASMGLKTLTSSPALGFLTFLIGSLVVAAYSPYVSDLITRFGMPIVIATLASIAVFLFLLWKGRRKISDAGRGIVWTG